MSDILRNFFQQFLPAPELWLTWLMQAVLAVGLLALIAGLLIAVLGRIPFVGPVLAGIVRILAGNYEKWLSERVPKLAETAVLATEERFRASTLPPPDRAAVKLQNSIAILQKLTPGLSRGVATNQVQAALARIRGAGLEQKSLEG